MLSSSLNFPDIFCWTPADFFSLKNMLMCVFFQTLTFLWQTQVLFSFWTWTFSGLNFYFYFYSVFSFLTSTQLKYEILACTLTNLFLKKINAPKTSSPHEYELFEFWSMILSTQKRICFSASTVVFCIVDLCSFYVPNSWMFEPWTFVVTQQNT